MSTPKPKNMVKIQVHNREKAKDFICRLFRVFSSESQEFELEATTKIDDLKKLILGKPIAEYNDSLKTEDLEKILIFSSDQISFNPCGGVDDVDGKNSEATILDVFGQKEFIKIEYIIDPTGYFHITSEGKDRDVLVGHFKHHLRRNIPASIDLRSATLEEFPVKLKVVFQTNKSTKKLIVKEYLLDKCAKGEPVNIKIKENGHIVIQDKNEQELYVKTDNDSRRLEFLEDTSETGLGRYYECDDSKLEPFSIPTTIDTIDQEMTIASSNRIETSRFWMDKEVIQNALHCCIASYKNSDYSADTYLKEHIKNEKFQNLKEPGKKNTMAMVDTTLYVAFEGTNDATDILDDVSIKMANCSDNWSDCKDVEFHSGFLQRAKEGMEWVQSVIEAEKPKKVILCGHSLGGAISALVYLTLAKGKSFENNQYQLYNVTFASPMFGNMALKYWYEENCAEFGKNMFHFVCDDDVVPASLYANYAFNQLSIAFKIAIKTFTHGYLINSIVTRLLKPKIDATSEQIQELNNYFKKMENILIEKKKRFADKHQKNEPFYFGKGVYVPIGQYLLLKKSDGDKIELFELGDNSEIVGEELSKSLEIISKLGLTTPSTWKDTSKKLLEAHTIGGCENGYFAKITSLPWMCDKIVDENPRTKRQGIKRENSMPDVGSKNTKATRNV